MPPPHRRPQPLPRQTFRGGGQASTKGPGSDGPRGSYMGRPWIGGGYGMKLHKNITKREDQYIALKPLSDRTKSGKRGCHTHKRLVMGLKKKHKKNNRHSPPWGGSKKPGRSNCLRGRTPPATCPRTSPARR